MPQIPTYQQRQRVNQLSQRNSIATRETTETPSARVADFTSQAVSRLGSVLGQASNVMADRELIQRRQADENAKAQAINRLSDFQIGWTQKLQSLKNSSSVDGSGFLQSTIGQFDGDAEKLLSEQQNPVAKEFLQSRLNALKLSTAEDAMRFESEAGVRYRAGQFLESGRKRSQVVYQNPAWYSSQLSEIDELLPQMDMPPKMREEIRNTLKSGLSDAAARGVLNKNPQAFLEMTSDLKKAPAFIQALDVRQIDQYRNQAEAEIKRGTSLNLQMIRENEANAHAQYMSLGRAAGVPSLQDLELVYPKEEAKTRYDSLQESRRVGETIQSMRNLSESERQDILAKESPREGEDFRGRSARFREIVQASQQIRQEIQTDPAGFVLREWPEAQIAYSKMLENPTPENVAEYAMLQSAEQRRQGVMNPNLLTAEMANQIAQKFQTPPNDQENPKTVIQGLSQQWGKYWPTVFKQLSRDNKLPDSAMVIANISDPNAQNILARAAGTKISDLEKGLPAADVSESTGIPYQIRESLRPMLTSMSHNANGEDTFKKIFDSAHKLALVYTRQGSNSTDAAKKAVDQIVNERYAFLDKNRTRIPKVERPDDVFTGATAYLKRELPNLDVLIPKDHLRFYPNEKVRQKEIKAHIQNSAVWLPDSEETGLALYYTARDNTLVPVMTSGEKRIFFTWQELRKMEPYSFMEGLRGTGKPATQQPNSTPNPEPVRPAPGLGGRIF